MPFVGGLIEHECPRCHRPVELPLGTICPNCRREIEQRAARLARWASALSTAALAVYFLLRLPPDPRGRLVVAMGVGIWYVLSNLVVRRAARELLP